MFKFIILILDCFILGDLRKEVAFSIKRVAGRLAQVTKRKDFMSPILEANDEHRITIKEIESSFNIFVVAGSETTATPLSSALYHLASRPSAFETLLRELRSTFLDGAAVKTTSVQNLPYLNAVLEESLRIYPPSAFAQARIVPRGGAVICGQAIPEGTSVGVATWAASVSETNWKDAGSFRPERWLGDGWDGDDHKAMQPSLLGPRSCLGKNLAYVEM